MQLKTGTYCPLLKKDCIGLQCNWFIQIRGTNPNTGADVDEWGCSIAWLPHLLIENANQTRQAGAAVESMRNESVRMAENTVRAILVASNIETMKALPSKDE
jgi:hypothetical protein